MNNKRKENTSVKSNKEVTSVNKKTNIKNKGLVRVVRILIKIVFYTRGLRT